MHDGFYEQKDAIKALLVWLHRCGHVSMFSVHDKTSPYKNSKPYWNRVKSGVRSANSERREARVCKPFQHAVCLYLI